MARRQYFLDQYIFSKLADKRFRAYFPYVSVGRCEKRWEPSRPTLTKSNEPINANNYHRNTEGNLTY